MGTVAPPPGPPGGSPAVERRDPARAPLRQTLRRSVLEGIAYAVMVGLGEVWFVPDAIRLGATPLEIVLVTTAPLFFGSLGPLLVLEALRRAVGRRRLVVGSVLGQVACLLAMAALDGTQQSTARSVLLLACLYQAFGQGAGTAWSSWFGEVVPARIRGHWFARRTRWVHLFTFLGLASAGFYLQFTEPPPGAAAGSGGMGHAVVFLMAALARALSALLMRLSWEPPFAGLQPSERKVAAHDVLDYLRGDDGRGARRLLPLAACTLLAVCLAAPFFAAFMLKELRFDYATYMLAQATLVAVKLLGLPSWGRAVDRYGAKPVYQLAAVLTAIVPMPWVWVDGLGWCLAAQALSGAAWGAYEVSLFALLLSTADARRRPLLFAAHHGLNGVGQLAGGLLGGLLFNELGFGYRWIFFLSFAARLVVAMAIPAAIRGLGPVETISRKDLLLRVIGFRPHGGIVHRPIPEVTQERLPPVAGPEPEEAGEAEQPEAPGAPARSA